MTDNFTIDVTMGPEGCAISVKDQFSSGEERDEILPSDLDLTYPQAREVYRQLGEVLAHSRGREVLIISPEEVRPRDWLMGSSDFEVTDTLVDINAAWVLQCEDGTELVMAEDCLITVWRHIA